MSKDELIAEMDNAKNWEEFYIIVARIVAQYGSMENFINK